jgi:hypothetical protein
MPAVAGTVPDFHTGVVGVAHGHLIVVLGAKLPVDILKISENSIEYLIRS